MSHKPHTPVDRVSGCCLCRKGWLTLYRDLPDEGFVFAATVDARTVVVPCTCSGGNKIIERDGLTQAQIQNGRATQRKAERQARWLKQLDGDEL